MDKDAAALFHNGVNELVHGAEVLTEVRPDNLVNHVDLLVGEVLWEVLRQTSANNEDMSDAVRLQHIQVLGGHVIPKKELSVDNLIHMTHFVAAAAHSVPFPFGCFLHLFC